MMVRTLTNALLFSLTLTLAGCGADDMGPADDGSLTQGDLSSAERDSVVFTREEEKLARDVYAALDAHDPVFANIRQSEQTHMDAVATLLARYDVPDPADGKAPGAFTNVDLQALYDTLVGQGQPSRQAALAVGVEIEELDIHDIEQARVAVSHTDILTTYDNLTRGSRNHLRTFYGKLVASGATYTPKYLDTDTFTAIADSPAEHGP